MNEFEQTPADPASGKPQYRLKKSVVLVGMMGAGKTAVGRALAAKLGVPFLDSDHEIEAAANLTVPEIFARDGEPFFRKRETEVIARLLEEQPGILSTGGGAFLAQENRDLISAKGVSVWLEADVDLIWNRVRHRNTRPLLRSNNPRKTLQEIFTARVPIYKLANLSTTSKPDLSVEKMASKVLDTLLSRPDVLERTDA
ncbi:shikimate kinase [Sulfitobacter marinus]|uniref:Shikimate kinase n=1 Tax=Sulfitobacter marinus TaxID=394264 RepID=A0A1I6QIC2_9RHOB|nr:shikimate kinase [Sulfitobacter marinus]SFS52201.1 shikimate kinase [Sulfitobacter marinus]